MAVQAAVTEFKERTVAQFEQKQTQLAMSTTRETQKKGNVATWLVSGSNGDTAVTRGQNGDIPYGGPTNSQVSATLAERLARLDAIAAQGTVALPHELSVAASD